MEKQRRKVILIQTVLNNLIQSWEVIPIGALSFFSQVRKASQKCPM